MHCIWELTLRCALNSQINRLSAGDLPHLFDIAAAHGCHGWQVILTVPAGRGADEPELLLQPEDLVHIMPVLSELSTRCKEAGIRFLPGNNIGYFGPFEHQLRGALRCPSEASCSAGRSVLGTEANGDIKGCPLVAHARLGRRQRARSRAACYLGAQHAATLHA